jgi:protein TonB
VEPEPEPVPEPPKEAPRAPERRTETPKTAERREPERPATNRTPPAANNRPPANRPASSTTRTDNRGTSPSDVRSTGEGRRTTPATGRNPDASSPGGEGLTIRTRGQPCPTRGFCENIVRQVVRFLRVPESAAGSRGDVCFTLDRRGGVDELSVERQRGGGAAFRIALMEAAEQAGRARAFGGLPAAFGADAFPVCVEIEPSLTR